MIFLWLFNDLLSICKVDYTISLDLSIIIFYESWYNINLFVCYCLYQYCSDTMLKYKTTLKAMKTQ